MAAEESCRDSIKKEKIDSFKNRKESLRERGRTVCRQLGRGGKKLNAGCVW
jgi:hypothetical protein